MAAANVFKGSPELGQKIRERREELGHTINEISNQADISVSSWNRYEAGGDIRKDKIAGLCKALRWVRLPNSINPTGTIEENINEEDEPAILVYKPVLISRYSGTGGEVDSLPICAGLLTGLEFLKDVLDEALDDLSEEPRGTHIGMIDTIISYRMPEQFLTEYDYEFIYGMRAKVLSMLRAIDYNKEIEINTVMDDIILDVAFDLCETWFDNDFVIKENSSDGKEVFDSRKEHYDFDCYREDVDLFLEDYGDDCLIDFVLYDDEICIPKDSPFHVSHWFDVRSKDKESN